MHDPENSAISALNALIEASEGHAGKITTELLKEAYQIEFDHQFDEDRTISIRKLEELVERFIERQNLEARS